MPAPRKAPRKPLVLGAVLALALLLAGCGGSATGPGASAAPGKSAAGEAGNSTASPDSEYEWGLPARTVDFTAKTLDGKAFDGATALAGKPTVIWFWAPWCPVCHADAPGIQTMSARYGQQVSFLGIAGRGTTAEMNKFVSQTGLGQFPHVVDANGSIWTRFEVTGQPAFAFVTRDGAIRAVAGSLTDEQLEQRIVALGQP